MTLLLILLKTRHPDQNGVTYAKPQVTKLGFNLNIVLAVQRWNFKPVKQESPDQLELGNLLA